MNTIIVRTISQIAREACEIQDACNLSGVVASYARALSDLRTAGIVGTDALRAHPVARAYADKIASLTDIQFDASVAGKAHNDCAALAGV